MSFLVLIRASDLRSRFTVIASVLLAMVLLMLRPGTGIAAGSDPVAWNR